MILEFTRFKWGSSAAAEAKASTLPWPSQEQLERLRRETFEAAFGQLLETKSFDGRVVDVSAKTFYSSSRVHAASYCWFWDKGEVKAAVTLSIAPITFARDMYRMHTSVITSLSFTIDCKWEAHCHFIDQTVASVYPDKPAIAVEVSLVS